MTPPAADLRAARWRQAVTVFRLELGRVLLSRRRLWVYALALAPVALFGMFVVRLQYVAAQRVDWAAHGKPGLTAADFMAIQPGMTQATVLERLGEPPVRDEYHLRRRGHDDKIEYVTFARWNYAIADGTGYSIQLRQQKVTSVHRMDLGPSLGAEQTIFASVFQFFTVRLVVFFGCLGIFMNLFRGELLDRSLHFYFLAPVRREVVMAGKFAAGLVAAVIIFCGSVAVQLALLAWQLNPAARAELLAVHHGWAQAGAYIGITALGCLGYGAFFLAAGMVIKNPIVPAAALLIWESINPFLPSLLRHISIIYYLTALQPVSVASAPGTPALIALLASGPGSISSVWAVVGLLVVAALLLWLAARQVRRMEIDYASE